MIPFLMACRCELRKRIKAAAVPFVPERTVYMDYNATTPPDPRVIGAFDRACRKHWGNPSSLHSAGSAAWNEIEELRNTAADFFGADSEGFHLCSSGTEAASTLLFGLAARRRENVFITTPIEHQAVRHPLFHLGRNSPAAPSGYNGRLMELGVDENGKIDIAEAEYLFRENDSPVMIYSPVNHETGSVQPVMEIYEAAQRENAVVILDAVQTAVRMEPARWAPFCDAFCVSGHKLYAPKGTALLWKKSELRPAPLRFGGNQEGGLFPGTENTPGAAALAEALRIMKKEQSEELGIISTLSRDGLAILKKNAPAFTIESPKDSAPGIICISLDNAADMETLLFGLNERGICLSRFSACTEKIDGPSNTLLSMGRSPHRASRSLRISLGRWSKRDDFFKLSRAMNEILG